MFQEMQPHDVKVKKLIQHPKISFVYYYGKEYSCLQHPELARMNRGAIRQHIQGKKHRLNFDTGEPLRATENISANLDEHVKKWPNQETTKTGLDNVSFWDFKEKLEAIFQTKDREVAFLLINYCFEGKLSVRIHASLEARNFRRYYENKYKKDVME
jgi:hypothetical protein